jgi:ABC-type transport system involved in cytochrome c biogenesis permease subunit
LETILTFFWFAVVLYGVSALFYLLSFIHKKEYFIRRGVIFAWLGFLSHTLCLSFYWTRPSYLSFSTFQIINDAAWAGVFIFLLIFLFARFVNPAGILIMPLTIFLLIWAVISEKEIGTTPPSFDTLWFWIHVITSALAYGFVLVAGAIGLLYLFKTRYTGDAFYDRLPDLKKLDNSNYLFIGLGFVMLTLMIISGSLWTKQVHGSYWAWDPLEVQSLISWLVYAIWLHLRLTFGWRGKRLAWYALFALPVMVIAIWGIPLVPGTFHRGFRAEHLF